MDETSMPSGELRLTRAGPGCMSMSGIDGKGEDTVALSAADLARPDAAYAAGERYRPRQLARFDR